MDRLYEHQGTTFIWNDQKAADNERKHAVRFEEAATVLRSTVHRAGRRPQ